MSWSQCRFNTVYPSTVKLVKAALSAELFGPFAALLIIG
jgi:hypothetical protein